MSVERPTFSESWYRVTDMRPRLRNDVQITRQHWRGQLWHVVQDPANNQYFRLNEAGYRFVGMLDGRITVNDVWDATGAQLGDEAPTQGEAINLLAQLYMNNLLAGDVPPDAESLFRRYRKRRIRELQGRLTNILFIHFPLFDPDRFLNRWVSLVGWFFGPAGIAVWLGVIVAGLWAVAGSFGDLYNQGKDVLAMSNLPMLYVAMACIKAIHEFGHAFACKRIGRKLGSGGEVHQMGIMMLVFTPLPYVDASSSWSFRNKWHRFQVDSGGMYVELFMAAIAAMIWTRTAQGTTLNSLMYNVMFIASVSTILFNANPLLRYDGYYILSDIIEMPNLRQRSNEYIYYVIRKYGWGVRGLMNPAHSAGERVWLTIYGIASNIYRVFICSAIILFVAQKFLMLGAIMAVVAIFTWVVLPLAKFVRYLLASPQLARVRPRAIISTLVVIGGIVLAIGKIPVNDDASAGGIIRGVQQRPVRAVEPGSVSKAPGSVLPNGTPVRTGDLLIACDSGELELERSQQAAMIGQIEAQLHKTYADRDNPSSESDPEAKTPAMLEIELKDAKIELARIGDRLADLQIKAPCDGVWICPDDRNLPERYLNPNDAVGFVVSLDDLEIRVQLTQDQADRTLNVGDKAEIRRAGAAERLIPGHITQYVKAAQDRLPSPALGIAAGGEILTAPDDKEGTRAAEPYFDIRVKPDELPTDWRPGMRVKVHFAQPPRPLAQQWYRSIRQMLQKRFNL